MQFKLLLTAALASSATADFVIYTLPIPKIDSLDFASAINSFSSAIVSRVGQLTQSLPASEIRAAVSANSALQNFFATASVSVPAQVTELGKYERFTTTPSWYTALPSDLRAYYDGNNAKVQSAINEVAGRTGSAPTRTGSAQGASGTGAAGARKVRGYMGAGAAAAFGVFVL